MSFPGPFVVTPMQEADIPEVVAIDNLSFSTPWQADAYRHELTQRETSHFFVVRLRTPATMQAESATTSALHPSPLVSRLSSLADRWRMLRGQNGRPRPAVVGYGGLWLWLDEAHISTIAVHPDWRGRGLGELLLLAMLERSIELKAAQATLEVRVSNQVAQNLYRKYEFEIVGIRRRYYRDNGEDAYIMTVPALDAAYARRLARLRQALAQRLERLRAY